MPSSKSDTFETLMKEWINIPRLHDLLPYESYEPPSQLFYNEGATGFVLSANPIVGAGLEDQQQMAHFFRTAGNLTEGTSMQFLLFASPCIGPYLDYWKDARSESLRNDPIFQKLALRRSEFLNAKAYHDLEGFLIRDYRLLIIRFPGTLLNRLRKTGCCVFEKK